MLVYIQFNDEAWENDIRVMIKAFYPEAKIVTDLVDKEEEPSFCVSVTMGYVPDGVVIRREEDKEVPEDKEYEFELVVSQGEDTVKAVSCGLGRKGLRNELKRNMYDIFKKKLGRDLPWGTLTGVRPTKIVYGMLEEGKSKPEIADYLKKEYYVSDRKIDLSYSVATNEKRMLDMVDFENGYSLYVGVPFCPTTCLYCSFTSYPLCLWKNKVDDYVEALVKEMKACAGFLSGRTLDTFYMGGGTPTTLEPHQLDRVLGCFEEYYDVSKLKEYTVEAGRPDSITREKLLVLKKHGVDRISINPQTMNDDTLKLIGRQHNVAQIKEAYALARECGFENINMDIIIGLPGEDEAHIRRTLDEITAMSPDSLTVHSLAIKRASRLNILWEQYKDYSITNTDMIMDLTYETALNMGMEPYYLYRQKNMAGNFENVGYSKKGKEGLYNILIMEEKENIIACGAGASTKAVFHSENRIERAENVKDVTTYIDNIDEMIDRKRRLLNV